MNFRQVYTLKNAAIAAAVSLALGSGVAVAQEPLKEVKIAVGGAHFLDSGYYFVLLPEPLGYWKEEGYKANVFPIPGSQPQQLATDAVDLALMSSTSVILSNTEHSLPIRSLITNFTLGWGVAVKKDGPIKSVTDLEGQKVGTISLGSGGTTLFKSFLKNNGMSEGDVTLMATGMGAQALLALQNDDVQGLLYWPSALVGFQNVDPGLVVMRDPEWAKMPDFSLATIQKTIEEKPEMVEGIARGMAKAMVFTAANPDCARKVIWDYYPDSKPTGVEEAKAISNDLAVIDALLKHQAESIALNGDGMIGANAKTMGVYQDFLFDSGLVTKKVDPENLVISTPGFLASINDFDKAAIEASAKACDF